MKNKERRLMQQRKYDDGRSKTPERRKYQKRWRKKNRKELSEYTKKYYYKNKLELVAFMGGRCVKCGLKPEDVDNCMGVFVIDEVKPLGIGKKKFTNLSKKDLEFTKKLFLEGKIQLLCQNCSAFKSWKNGDYAHRTNQAVD